MTDQTFFQNCSKTLATLSGQAAEDFLAAVCRDIRSGNTSDQKVNFLLDIEVMAKGINELLFSQGHVCFIAGYEYFTIDNGDLYRAPELNPVMADGRRCGRWQTKTSMVQEYIEMVKGC